MLCEMPVLNLPAEFMSSNDTRREGTAVSTLRTDGAVANLYIGFVLDNLLTFTNISEARPSISITLIPLRASFVPAGSEPIQYDPNVSKYLILKVRTTNFHCIASYLISVFRCSVIPSCSPPDTAERVILQNLQRSFLKLFAVIFANAVLNLVMHSDTHFLPIRDGRLS